MRKLIRWGVASGISLVGLSAQKLETLPPDTGKVVRVETAADHLTVIELGSPITMVAIGNQDSFTIERRDNKVFVKPVEDGAKTNLFIWTSAGRFAYELVPAKVFEQVDFAIDQTPVPAVAEVPQPAEKEEAGLPAEMLSASTPVQIDGDRHTAGHVEVEVRDLYRRQDRLYLRYAILNNTAHEYAASRPAVWSLAGVHCPQSLITLGEHQLDPRLVRSLRAESTRRLEVVDAGPIGPVRPGSDGSGWLAVEIPDQSGSGPAVLRLEFTADTVGAVDAVLVMSNRSDRQEVANARSAGK